MDLMAEQGTFFTPTIAFLPTWYATYPPVYVPELHDKYEAPWSRRSCSATTTACARPRSAASS